MNLIRMKNYIFGAAVLLTAGWVWAETPNFVVIMVDDMGYECIGANGCAEYSTPVVDGLAANGLRFANAHSTPVCTPTRTQILQRLFEVWDDQLPGNEWWGGPWNRKRHNGEVNVAAFNQNPPPANKLRKKIRK
jgi:hypothetical protein